MRKLSPRVILVLLLVRLVCAQDKNKDIGQAALTFTSNARLVILPVLVDRSGKHVSGLNKADFTILEDGQPQAISSFEEVHSSPVKRALRSVPKAGTEFTNVGEDVAQHYTIIVYDLIWREHMRGIDYENAIYARRGVVKYLKDNLSINEPVALLRTDKAKGLAIVHDFTTDTSVLLSALDKAENRFLQIQSDIETSPTPSDESLDNGATGEAFRVQYMLSGTDQSLNRLSGMNPVCQTAAGVRLLARALAGLPGRKSLIWISEIAPIHPPRLNNTCGFDTEREFANANVSIYPVDSHGLMAPFGFRTGINPTGSEMQLEKHGSSIKASSNSQLGPYLAFQDDMRYAAQVTGGRFFVNTNDLAGSIARASADSAEYYQLTYYLKPDTKPGWHKLEVKVNQPHVEVRTRSGFLTENRKPSPDADELKQALGSPFMLTEVPLLVRWAGIGGGSDSKRVDYELSVPASALLIDDADRNHLSLSITATARNGDKTVEIVNKNVDGHMSAETLARFAKTGFNFSSAFELAPGQYEVRFAVRDNISGKVGTVIASLEAK